MRRPSAEKGGNTRTESATELLLQYASCYLLQQGNERPSLVCHDNSTISDWWSRGEGLTCTCHIHRTRGASHGVWCTKDVSFARNQWWGVLMKGVDDDDDDVCVRVCCSVFQVQTSLLFHT